MSSPNVLYIEATPLDPTSKAGKKSAADGELLTHTDMVNLRSSDFTHVILSFFHFNDFTSWVLNYNGFDIQTALYTEFWNDVTALQNNGIKVLISMGGAGDNFWASVTRDSYKGTKTTVRDFVANNIISFVNSKGLNGVDLDQEDGSDAGLANLAYALVNSKKWNKLLLSMVPTSGDAVDQWNTLTNTPGASISPNDIDLVNIQFYSGGYTSIYNDNGGNISYTNTPFTNTYASLAQTIPQSKLIAGLLPIVPYTSRYSGLQISPNGRPGHGVDDCVGAIEALYPNVGGVAAWRYMFVKGQTNTKGDTWDVAMAKAIHNISAVGV